MAVLALGPRSSWLLRLPLFVAAHTLVGAAAYRLAERLNFGFRGAGDGSSLLRAPYANVVATPALFVAI
jgi:hypothetical protein